MPTVNYYYQCCIQILVVNLRCRFKKNFTVRGESERRGQDLQSPSSRRQDFRTHRLLACASWKPVFSLWRTRCISTGWNVQKMRFHVHENFYPPSLHREHIGFPADSKWRKPLMLWKNPGLSTQIGAFTTTTILYTSY